MKKLVFLGLLISSPAFADNPPTVTLTQEELTALIKAESNKAVYNYLAKQDADKAQSAYDKIHSSFQVKTPPTPEPTH